jgi:phosphatidylglycerol lysyltransferase
MTAVLQRAVAEAAAAERILAGRRQSWWGTAVRGVRAAPVALALAALVAAWTLAATLAGWGPRQLGASPVPLQEGEWWRVPATLVTPSAPGWLPLLIPVLLVCVAYAERRLGSLGALVAYVATGLLGATLGTLAQAGLDRVPGLLPGVDLGQTVLDPTGALSGMLIAVSFAAGSLWRRRIRVVIIAAGVLAVVYGGGAADVHRLTAALSGFAVGALLVRRTGPSLRPRFLRSSHREVRSLLAALVALSAVGPLVAIATRSPIGPLAPLVAVLAEGLPHGAGMCLGAMPAFGCAQTLLVARLDDVGPVVLALMPLVALLVAAVGLRRGRRFALWLAVAVNVALAAFAIVFYVILPLTGAGFFPGFAGYDEARVVTAVVSTAVPLAVAVLLVILREQFPVRAPAEAVRRFVAVFAVSLATLCVLYVGGGVLLSDEWMPRATVASLLADLPERFVPAGYVSTDVGEFLPLTWSTRLLFHWTGPALWTIGLLGALPLFLGSSRMPKSGPAAQVRRLLRQEGGNSIGHMSTWPGNLQWVSPAGDAAIAYRVVSGVALTVGGPICAPHRRFDAVTDFAQYCYEHGWLPCFYSLREEDYGDAFASLGWATVRVGEEMTLDPRTTSFSGRSFQVIRTSVNGASRLGIEARWTRYRDLSLSESLQVREISEQWVAEKGLPEMGFTLGGLDELEDPDVRLLVAVGPDGGVHGFTSWLPRFRNGAVVGWTLDVMRRRADGFPRVMEFLIAAAVTRFAQDGVEEVSLAAAPLASSTPTATAGVLDVLARALEPAYGFRSLLAFKAKFRPDRRPLIVATPDALMLPVVAGAVLRAYLPKTSPRARAHLLGGLLRRQRSTGSATVAGAGIHCPDPELPQARDDASLTPARTAVDA